MPRLRRRVLRFLDELDHFVDVVDGDLQAFEDVLAVLGALQLELGAQRDDGVAVLDEVLEQLEQVSSRGVPSTSASMMAPKVCCICVCL